MRRVQLGRGHLEVEVFFGGSWLWGVYLEVVSMAFLEERSLRFLARASNFSVSDALPHLTVILFAFIPRALPGEAPEWAGVVL